MLITDERGKTMLIFPLKKQWYEKIKSGEKTVEYREVKPYWGKRLFRAMLPFTVRTYYNEGIYTEEPVKQPCSCKLRLGYTNKYMTANIIKIEIVDGKNTDLHIDKPVYAIHLADVREVQNEN